MGNYTQTRELHLCEKLIVDMKDYVYTNYGLKRMMKSSRGFKKMKFIITPLFKLKRAGFILIFLLVVFENRSARIALFREKLIFVDHSNDIIKKLIFSEYETDYEANITYKDLHCSLRVFIDLELLKRLLKSYSRAQPNSSASAYALCEFWFYYVLFSLTFPLMNLSGVLMVDEPSGRRLAIMVAAREAGLRRGMVRLLDEPHRVCPFYNFDVLFCWNYIQADELKNNYRIAGHIERSFHPIKQLPLAENQSFSVGVALKSLFNEEGFLRLLKELNSKTWVREVIVRFHPGTKLVYNSAVNEKMSYKLSDDCTKLFFAKIDFLISGSTSLVKEALLSGVPVAYKASLDTEVKKDAYSYVKNGVVYDLQDGSIEKNTLKEINNFYESSLWTQMRDQWLKAGCDTISISEALKKLL